MNQGGNTAFFAVLERMLRDGVFICDHSKFIIKKKRGISDQKRNIVCAIVLNAKLNKKKNKENSQNKRKSLIKVNE